MIRSTKDVMIWAVVAILVLAGCKSPTSGSSSTTNSSDASATSILRALGVKEVDSPPAATVTTQVGTTQTVDPTTWQPMKKLHSVFNPLAEVYQFGVADGTKYNNTYNSYSNYYANGSAATPYAGNTAIGEEQSWANTSFKTGVSADLNNDGLAEAVLFYVLNTDLNKVYCRVGKTGSWSSSSVLNYTPSSSINTKYYKSLTGGSPWFPYFTCYRGDLDGDGKDEILLVDYKTLLVLSVTDSGTVTVKETKTFTNEISGVSTGDMDGDGRDEIAVGFVGGTYALYDSSLSSPLGLTEFMTFDSSALFVEPTFGDYDGDGVAELALSAAENVTGTKIVTQVYDFTTPGTWTMTPVTPITTTKNYFGSASSGSDDAYRILGRAVDIDGDGKDDLEIAGTVYTTPLATPKEYDFGSSFLHGNEATLVDAVVGDVDGDGKGDVVFLSAYGDTSTVQAIGLNSSGVVAAKKVFLDQKAHLASTWSSVALLAGNFEDNAPRVKYTGHTLTFTQPIVIALLVAPPYYSSIAKVNDTYNGSLSNLETSFGTTTTASTSTGHTVGFSVGASVEYEHDFTVPIFAIKVGSIKASVAFSHNTSWSWSSTHEVSKSITYKANASGDDMVIFTSVPMDQYSYVIEHTNDTVNNPVGGTLSISIPREYSQYVASRTAFNSAIGQLTPVDNKVVQHTIGVPSTYPTKSAMLSILGVSSIGATTLATDTATFALPGDDATYATGTDLAIEVTDSTEKTLDLSDSVDTSLGAGIGDFTVSATAGFNTSYTATSTASKGTQFGGTIGYLPKSFQTTQYTTPFGIFAYSFYSAGMGHSFWVVNYYRN